MKLNNTIFYKHRKKREKEDNVDNVDIYNTI